MIHSPRGCYRPAFGRLERPCDECNPRACPRKRYPDLGWRGPGRGPSLGSKGPLALGPESRLDRDGDPSGCRDDTKLDHHAQLLDEAPVLEGDDDEAKVANG